MKQTNARVPLVDPELFQNSDDPLQTFCEELILAAGLDRLPEDFKLTYLARLKEEVLKRVGVVALTYLDADNAKEIVEKIEQDQSDSKGMLTMLQQKIKDFDQKMAKALDEFASSFIASVRAASKASA